MKKILTMLLTVALLCTMAGCASNDIASGGLDGDSPAHTYSAIEGKGDGSSLKNGSIDGELADADDIPMDAEGILEDTSSGTQNQEVAGVLTAGEWKDADNLEFWSTLLNRNDWYQLMEDRALYTNNVVTVTVKDADGNPCFNVAAQLVGTNGDTIYEARTDINGKAYLLYDLNHTKETATAVVVNNKTIPLDGNTLEVTAEDAGIEATALDLMFMIDTTGSMDDELEYIKTELEDVVTRVAKSNEALSIRISVNFYRDEDDEYVVKDFEFTNDVKECIQQISAQTADGGGDFPEAVHTALDNAIHDHQWRGNAVKLCFLVADASPHDESEVHGINAQLQQLLKDAAQQGIRIIPVASSGVRVDTEFMFRSFALMTGGTYTFLTDHSGIGNSHLEPTIGEYEVKPLNDLLVDIILRYCSVSKAA